jgi:hypothetical protein
MEENKYYTPNLEEFHIGFEYEYNYRNKGWFKNILGCEDLTSSNDGFYEHYNPFTEEIEISNIRKTEFRVKCLDKEDIESLGFIQDENDSQWFDYKTERYWIYKENEKDWRWIISDEESEVSFAGKIKNKSELKKIMQMLGIYEK